MADWSEAGKIGGIGFATVIVVLSILALAIWILGLVAKRFMGTKKQEPKGD